MCRTGQHVALARLAAANGGYVSRSAVLHVRPAVYKSKYKGLKVSPACISEYVKQKLPYAGLFHWETMSKLNQLPIGDRVEYLKEFIADRISLESSVSPGPPITVLLMPKVIKRSRLDDRVLLSKFNWWVTLVRNGGIMDNHAMLIIEGVADQDQFANNVNNGDYFMFLAHFDEIIPLLKY
jgi:hypothetical protein